METMTYRRGVTTYKALELNENRIVVIKVIKKHYYNTGLFSSLKELEMFESSYLARYMKCYEDENEYGV